MYDVCASILFAQMADVIAETARKQRPEWLTALKQQLRVHALLGADQYVALGEWCDGHEEGFLAVLAEAARRLAARGRITAQEAAAWAVCDGQPIIWRGPRGRGHRARRCPRRGPRRDRPRTVPPAAGGIPLVLRRPGGFQDRLPVGTGLRPSGSAPADPAGPRAPRRGSADRMEGFTGCPERWPTIGTSPAAKEPRNPPSIPDHGPEGSPWPDGLSWDLAPVLHSGWERAPLHFAIGKSESERSHMVCLRLLEFRQEGTLHEGLPGATQYHRS